MEADWNLPQKSPKIREGNQARPTAFHMRIEEEARSGWAWLFSPDAIQGSGGLLGRDRDGWESS
jgi:hypothetical protein